MDGTSTQDQETGGAAASVAPEAGYTVDIGRIMQAIPHRYPFLMIDRVVNIVHGRTAVGIKNVTMNEPYFQGHFPQYPLMPGVLVLEAFGQTAAVLIVESLGGPQKVNRKGVYLMSIEMSKFRRPVGPGDQLRLHVESLRNRGQIWKFNGIGRVDGVTVAEGTFTAMVADRTRQGSSWADRI
jgi:3-hydroxyacyl-[acyl-carrier-protein] dehydratase